MNELGIWAIATVFVASIVGNAAAEIDLDTVDLGIEYIQMQKFDAGFKQTADLVKLELIFKNNGDDYYTLKGSSNQLLFVLVPPYTSYEEIIQDEAGKNIIDVFEQVSEENFAIQYRDLTEMAEGCEKVNFSLRTGESKKVLVCYIIPLDGIPRTTDRIERNQFYLRLVTAPYGSSCPNCKMIPLKDVPQIPLEQTQKLYDPKTNPDTNFTAATFADTYRDIILQVKGKQVEVLIKAVGEPESEEPSKRAKEIRFMQTYILKFLKYAKATNTRSDLWDNQLTTQIHPVWIEPLESRSDVISITEIDSGGTPKWIDNLTIWKERGFISESEYETALEYLKKMEVIP